MVTSHKTDEQGERPRHSFARTAFLSLIAVSPKKRRSRRAQNSIPFRKQDFLRNLSLSFDPTFIMQIQICPVIRGLTKPCRSANMLDPAYDGSVGRAEIYLRHDPFDRLSSEE